MMKVTKKLRSMLKSEEEKLLMIDHYHIYEEGDNGGSGS
jgi:hypothetical protein